VCAVTDIEASTRCRVEALYTFGSPRVGDDRFVKAFNRAFAARSFRIANTSDIVTSIPLPVPIAGIVGGYFSHVDTPVDMTIQKDDLETESQYADLPGRPGRSARAETPPRQAARQGAP